jgi:hypothetical protein
MDDTTVQYVTSCIQEYVKEIGPNLNQTIIDGWQTTIDAGGNLSPILNQLPIPKQLNILQHYIKTTPKYQQFREILKETDQIKNNSILYQIV